ncbi:MAG: beta-ketoacyl-ACP synthase III [Acidobacteriota bacterium]
MESDSLTARNTTILSVSSLDPGARLTEERIGLLGMGAYLPAKVMTNADWTRRVDTTDEWILTRTGIAERRFAADDESTADLAVHAARAALADAGVDPEALDEIVIATDTPEVYTPDTAAFVQHRLGARSIPAYDLGGSGCAGFLQALDVARSRAHEAGRCILVVGVEVLSRVMSLTDRTTCVLFGDGAGAVVLGRGERAAEILVVVTGTDGSRAGILGIETGGTRRPFSLEGNPSGRLEITMQGQRVFKEAVRRMSAAALEALEKAGLDLSDVALLVPHQANARIIDAVGKALKLPSEKVFVNVRDFGNTGSASVPIALAQAHREGRIATGDHVLLVSFGAGFHWGAALIRF